MNNWKENITFLLDNQDYTCADVWDKKNNLICAYKEKTKTDLKDKILSFLEFWEKQRFKIIFRTASTQAKENGYLHYIDTEENNSKKEDIQPIQPIIQGNNIEDIETTIQNGIKKGIEQFEFEKKKVEIEEKEKTLKTTAGQLAIVIERIAMQFIPNLAGQNSPIMQGIKTTVIDEISDKELKGAIEVILKHTSKEDVLKIAKAIEKKPDLINKALMFI